MGGFHVYTYFHACHNFRIMGYKTFEVRSFGKQKEHSSAHDPKKI